MRWLVIIFCVSTLCLAATHPPKKNPRLKRIKELNSYLKQEQPQFEKRRHRKRAISEELDAINAKQNRVRKRISESEMGYAELAMAQQNLRVEFKRQQDQEKQERERLRKLLKGLYRIQRDGMLRFVLSGGNLATFAARTRILFHTLRSNSKLTKQLAERAAKLVESEKLIIAAKKEAQKLLAQLGQQERTLKRLLKKKRKLLAKISDKQQFFLAARKEHGKMTKKVSEIFDNFETLRGSKISDSSSPKKLILPVDFGKVVKHFGRSVHKKFRTVTDHKGLEIQAEHKSPVYAVLPGTVEYKGWIKGLGNILILHHGKGTYSLNAHLFKSALEQGAKVQQGDTIAFVGDTGQSAKPSLYFELRKDGKAIDPLPYFTSDGLKKLS